MRRPFYMGAMDPKFLGQASPLPTTPEAAELDYVPNPRSTPYLVRFTAPEFTSLCPVTGHSEVNSGAVKRTR